MKVNLEQILVSGTKRSQIKKLVHLIKGRLTYAESRDLIQKLMLVNSKDI